jgi:ATP-binding cassette, subfamily C, bacterial CydD
MRTARTLLAAVPRARLLVAGAALTAVAAGSLAVVQAGVLAGLLASAFEHRLSPSALAWPLTILGCVVLLRAALAMAHGTIAARAAAAVKLGLRRGVLSAAERLGPGWLAGQRSGELATLAGRGLDALDPYVTGYLPQLALAATIPVAVLARLAWGDPLSAGIVALTLPLLVVFGVLIGLRTRASSERQWELLARLGGHFLDVVTGLPTLRALGRARAQAAAVRRIADAHRRATMRTLRVAFLSALVLEVVAAVSIALLAVPIGLRLLAGQMDLGTGLLVLLLAPEAYLPVRALGARFHAGVEGVAVAERCFELLDTAAERRSETAPGGGAPIPERATLRLDRVAVRHPGRDEPALESLSLSVAPGERLALVGPSGAGKSTVLLLLLGLVRPTVGRVLAGHVDLDDLDLEAWRRRIAWVPQRPHLFATSVAENIRLGSPGASLSEIRRAARAAAADEFISELPTGYETLLGERGHGLSAGQRQRIALARAFLRDPSIVLLDEPTARLDAASESGVLAASERLLAGRTVVLVAHRPALLAGVDRWVRLERGRIAAEGAGERAREVPA